MESHLVGLSFDRERKSSSSLSESFWVCNTWDITCLLPRNGVQLISLIHHIVYFRCRFNIKPWTGHSSFHCRKDLLSPSTRWWLGMLSCHTTVLITTSAGYRRKIDQLEAPTKNQVLVSRTPGIHPIRYILDPPVRTCLLHVCNSQGYVDIHTYIHM
ncbi:hypothetical protein F5Y05DRAFT_382873 [Hypoxylon sp. FL0543]|nr:hypothetical protein F5Y05DRAFT_382873 [Hypoxylon sp. FL0543]